MIRINFPDGEVLSKAYSKFLSRGVVAVKSGTPLVKGATEQVFIVLPDGLEMNFRGTVVEVIEREPGKAYSVILKLADLSDVALTIIRGHITGQIHVSRPVAATARETIAPAPVQEQKAAEQDGFARPVEQFTRSGEVSSEIVVSVPESAIAPEAPPQQQAEQKPAEAAPEEVPGKPKVAAFGMSLRKAGMSEQEVEKREALADFIVSFVRAMLRTGYYDPSHPQSEIAKGGLYEKFRNIIGEKREMSFMTRGEKEGREILLEGIEEAAEDLDSIIAQHLSGQYLPKFCEYFEKKKIRCFSLKQSLPENHFNKFLEIMAFAASGQVEVKDPQELTRTLVTNGITGVSVIFDDDVVGTQRKLPWRVQLAISRLCKELRLLPMFKSLTEDDIRRVKLQTFEDIIRPVRNPDLIRDILFNADLVSERITELSGVQQEEIILYIISVLPVTIVAASTNQLVDWIVNGRGRPPPEGADLARSDRAVWLIAIAKRKLLDEPCPEADQTLEHLCHRGVATFEELPPTVKSKIMGEAIVEYFMEDGPGFLRGVNSVSNPQEYGLKMETLVTVVGELLARKEYELLLPVARTLHEHCTAASAPFPKRQEIAALTVQRMWGYENMQNLKEQFLAEKKEMREHIIEMLPFIGEPAVPIMLEILKTSPDRWVRKSAIRSLEQVGPDAVDSLMKELRAPDAPWYYVRNLLLILGSLNARDRAVEIQRFLKYHSHQVREEALVALSRLLGKNSERFLIAGLSDENLAVRKRVIQCLGAMKTSNPVILDRFYDMLARATENPDEAKQVCLSLRNMGNVSFPSGFTAEQMLMSIVETGEKRGILSFLKHAATGTAPSNELRIAACQALADIGTKRCLPALRRLRSDADPEVRDNAAAAVEAIEKRGKGG